MVLTKNQLALIGKITTRFTALEFNISLFIGGLISNDVNVGHIITSNLAFSRLAELLKQLFTYKIKNKQLVKEFEDIAKRITEVNKKRNEFIHSSYAEVVDGDSWVKLKGIFRYKVNTRKPSEVFFHVEQINDLVLKETAKQIDELGADIMRFIFKLKRLKKLKIKTINPTEILKSP